MDAPLRRELLDILLTKGYRRFPEPVQLASGEWSADFVDGKEALADWPDLELAARAITEALAAEGIEFDAVGGLELGACALTVAVAAVARCRWFFVRKQAKDRGTRREVEGARLGPGDRVLVVEDVVTTGGSALVALERVQATGATVVAVATLVDRGEEAGRRLGGLGVAYLPMATYADLGIDPVGGAPPTSS